MIVAGRHRRIVVSVITIGRLREWAMQGRFDQSIGGKCQLIQGLAGVNCCHGAPSSAARNIHGRQQRQQGFAIRWRFQVVDDGRLGITATE